jgi:hypothetical protein
LKIENEELRPNDWEFAEFVVNVLVNGSTRLPNVVVKLLLELNVGSNDHFKNLEFNCALFLDAVSLVNK